MATQQYGWTITSQQNNQTVNDDANNTVVGAYIYFRTNDGNTGAVFVPDNLRTVKHVEAVVTAEAKLIDDIGRLKMNAS